MALQKWVIINSGNGLLLVLVNAKQLLEAMLLYCPLEPYAEAIAQLQRCQHLIFKMLDDFEIQSEKCLVYDEMVKNLPIFC